MKFYLDDTLYDNPFGWETLTERIYYEEGLSGYLQEISGSVTFYGGAYTYLLNLRNSALCNKVDVTITDVCADGSDVLIFEGFIFITDIDFNLIKCEATVEFVDNGFISKIDNNKGIKCYLGVDRSKNDIDISAYNTAQTNIALRDSANGADITGATGYRIFDAFKFIIAFMTDGSVDFVSDFFDPSGSGTDNVAKYTVVMNGEEIRTATATNFAYISFEELYEDLTKIFNLAFSVEQSGTRMALRIEPKEYYRQAGEINYFENPVDLNQSIPKDKLYAKVKFGSNTVASTYTYLQNIQFIGVHAEEYHLLGECNSSSILDLSYSNLITDTNIIQDVLPSGTGNDSYDENNFLIVLDSSNVNVASLKPVSATYYYNEGLSNLSVSQYWFGDVPNSIAIFLDQASEAFYADRTGSVFSFSGTIIPSSVPDTLLFNNDSILPGFDTGGNYVPATGRYTSPINNVYTFDIGLLITNLAGALAVGIVTYDSGGTGKYSKLIYNNSPILGAIVPPDANQSITPPIITSIEGSFSVYMDATDYCEVNIWGIGDLMISSFFRTNFAGGIAQTYDETQIPIIETNINHNISCNQWQTIKATPYKNFTIDYTDGIVKGWINEIQRNINTGEAQVILNSKPTN